MAEEKKINQETKEKDNTSKESRTPVAHNDINGVSERVALSQSGVSKIPPHRIEDGRMVFTTPLILQHFNSPKSDDSGEEWDNYVSCINVPRPDGSTRTQDFFFEPSSENKDIYATLADIIGYHSLSDKKCCIELVRVPVTENYEVIGYTYNPQVSYYDDNVAMFCPLKPKFKTDGVIFKNFVAQMRKNGVII